jgi:hypothetical protein
MTTPDDPDEPILTALARAEASLRVVLTAIAELKAEMNQRPMPDDIPFRPDPSWAGTP